MAKKQVKKQARKLPQKVAKRVAKKAAKKPVRRVSRPAARKTAAKSAPKSLKKKKIAKKAMAKTMKSPARKPTPKAAPRKVAPKRKVASITVRKVAPKKARKVAPRTIPKAAPKAAPKMARKPLAPAAKRAVLPPPAALQRPRRRLPDTDADAFIELSEDSRLTSSARAGHDELRSELRQHTEASPELTAGDVDAKWQDAYALGDEAPGGDNMTPDQDRVDDIGKALGIEYADDEELMGGEEVTARDEHRWELDPASKEEDEEE